MKPEERLSRESMQMRGRRARDRYHLQMHLHISVFNRHHLHNPSKRSRWYFTYYLEFAFIVVILVSFIYLFYSFFYIVGYKRIFYKFLNTVNLRFLYFIILNSLL